MRRWLYPGLIGLTAVFLLLLATNTVPELRGGSGWQWDYGLPTDWAPVLLLGGLLTLYIVGARLALRRASPLPAVLWALIGATVLAVAVVSVRGDPFFLLFTRTVSPVQTGASALAVRVMADEGTDAVLRRWTDVMAAANDLNLIHFTTSPPGQPLVHDTLARLFDTSALQGISQPISYALRPYQCTDEQVMRYTRGELVSAGFGMLMPLFAALAVIPLYATARDLTNGDTHTARRAVLWFPLIPALLLFAPTWNTLYPMLCITVFALLLHGLKRRRVVYALLAGVVMSLTTFLNFAVLPLLLLLGLFTLGYWGFVARHDSDHPGFLWTVINGVWFGIGLLSLWAVFTLATGISPLDILRVTFTSHRELVQRDYLAWLLLHPYDLFMFTGWVLVAFTGAGVWWAARRLTAPEAARDAAQKPLLVLALAFALTVLLVNLVGIVQGENARILLFYAPFFVLTAAVCLPRSRWEIPLLAAQAVTVLVMAAALPVVPLDLNPQPTAPRTDIASLGDLPFTESAVTFDSGAYAGAFRLEAYRFIADPSAQAITFEFDWRGIERTERPYQFEMIAYAENPTDGEIVSDPFRWLPQNANYLTPCWRQEDVVRDVVVLPLPPVSEPVVWTVALRAVDERTGDVMTLPDGSDALTLEPIRYP